MGLHHDDDVEVWIDGFQVFIEAGFVTGYVDAGLFGSRTANVIILP